MKKSKIICIIDDEEINQFILKTIIQNLSKGTQILSYENGEVALESLTQLLVSDKNMPDIILLDINMSVMSGWEFMDEFVKLKNQIGKKIAIYIISSSNAPEDKKKAKTYSDICGYLNRPIEAYTLKELIEKNG